MTDDNIDESNYFDTQDIAPTIEEIFAAFIGPIENIRSRFPTPDQLPFDLNNFATSIASARRSGTAANTPQESLCNAFYRALGLPIVDYSGRLYNPGYCPDDIDSEKITGKYNIAGAINKKIYDLLNVREAFPKLRLAVYKNSNEGSAAQALSLKVIKKPFSPLKDDLEPFDITDTQIYKINRDSFLDLFVNRPNINISEIKHIIKPFFVDPRIDFLVNPSSFRFGIPFLSTAELNSLGTGESYKVTLLESVCRIRFSDGDSTGNAPNLTDIAATIVANKSIIDKNLIAMSGNINNFFKSPVFISINLIKIIKSIVGLLYDARHTISEVDSKIAWVPKPSTEGAVVKSGTYQIDEIKLLLNNLSSLDQKILELELNNLTYGSSIDPYKATTSSYNTIFSNVSAVTLGAATSNIQRLFEARLNEAKSARDELSARAEQALFTISTIMGDDLGIGLLDMVIMFTALWTIDKTYLVSMLDDSAFRRLYDNNVELRCKEVNARNGANTAQYSGIDTLKAFQKQVQYLYTIADAFFETKTKNG